MSRSYVGGLTDPVTVVNIDEIVEALGADLHHEKSIETRFSKC